MIAAPKHSETEIVIYHRVGPSFLGRLFLFCFGCLLGGGDILAVIYGQRQTGLVWATLAFLGLLFGAWMAIQAAFYRGYIAIDSSRKELVLVERGFHPGTCRKKVPLDQIETVHFKLAGIRCGHWEVYLKLKNGSNKLFSILGGNESAQDVAKLIADTIGVTFSRI
jgi:hypothetical protein